MPADPPGGAGADRWLRDYACAGLLCLGLALGGASAAGVWANLALQIVSLIVIGVFVFSPDATPWPRGLAWLTAAAFALPLLQLIPLPPALWMLLPGREEIAAGFALARVSPPWLPIALDPDATLGVATALIAPLAMLFVALRASDRGRRLAVVCLVVFALGSALLGAAQVLGGEATRLQPYAVTNPGKATGLFANRNHLATLLLAALPFAAALAARRAFAALCGLLLLGLLLVGSSAGMALAAPVVGATLLFVFGRSLTWRWGAIVAVIALALGVAAVADLARRAAADPPGGAAQHRPAIIATTWRAAQDFWPVGAGGGAFWRIYPRYEDMRQASPEYRNHAHADYVELALDYGLPGAALVLAVWAWWGLRLRALWAMIPPDPLARAGAIALGAVLAHSLVDYPLRTAALAMVAALAATLAATPRVSEREAKAGGGIRVLI